MMMQVLSLSNSAGVLALCFSPPWISLQCILAINKVLFTYHSEASLF